MVSNLLTVFRGLKNEVEVLFSSFLGIVGCVEQSRSTPMTE